MRIFLLLIILWSLSLQSTALHPRKEYTVLPKHVELNPEEIKIETNDGATLNAWYFNNKGNHLIIISHDGDGNMSDYFRHIKTLCDQGFDVMAYDYRGYGSSSDFDINPYQYIYTEFYTDFEAVLNYCTSKYRQDIIVYGWGIGGGIGLLKAYDKDRVAGIIADDPFFSYKITHGSLSDTNSIMSFPIEVEKGHYDFKHPKAGKDLKGVILFHGSNNYIYSYEQLKHLASFHHGIHKEKIYPVSRGNYHVSFTKPIYNHTIYEFIMNI
ncbi:alpha/beta fold hydrolase [Reichenbachiella versicolor]|uniref:alpha/beta fold hydrolase n=1 Tax=Reichenbachiella versicolor TaxID=1821036 RepID=UPI000D6E96DB|nr:alpha/beta fold hydrolase [Reichenbachiella versicolor]